MKIAIVSDKSRETVLSGEEGIGEYKQARDTVSFLKEALSDEYEVINLVMDHDIIQRLEEENVDLVFNLCNGIEGEASLSQLPSFLEFADIPYTASSPLGHGLAYDKIYSGKIFQASNIDTPKFKTVDRIEEIDDMGLEYPLFVKPKDEGSSRGIKDDSLVHDKESLIKVVEEHLELYNPPIMVMEYIEGREFSMGILGNGKDVEVLPILEVDFSKLPSKLEKILSFEVKGDYEKFITYEIPAEIDKSTERIIKDTAIAVYHALSLRDYARIDIRIKNGKAYVFDVNSLPGLDKNTSNICFMAYKDNMSYEDLIKKIVNIAIKRYNI